MNLIDVLKIYGFEAQDPDRVMLMRHVDDNWDLEVIHRAGHINSYQASQGKDMLGDCTHLISFMGEAGSRCRFLGVYEIRGRHKVAPPWPAGFPYPEMNLGIVNYDLVKLPQFDVLADRLIIDWGAAARSWWQYLNLEKPKRVIEVLPAGFVRSFPGYEDVHVRFDELERIVAHREANRLWHTMLGGVAGVYLIVDATDGSQYVGSASGEEGILGRWIAYARTKHGGNKRLVQLLAQHPGRHTSFSFSILRTLSRSLTKKEVVAIENDFKRKLGSRAFGLNEN